MNAIGNHAFEVTTSRTQEDAIARVTTLLAEEGFGIVTQIDLQGTLRQKLGVETPPYFILGACNPALARRAVAADPSVGIFLPCNVVVRDEGDRRLVFALEPKLMAQVIDNAELRAVADEASARLRAALERVG